MKLGVPVIARNNPSHAAIIQHQSTGLLYGLPDVRTDEKRVLSLICLLTYLRTGN